jgi:hypothetical protein
MGVRCRLKFARQRKNLAHDPTLRLTGKSRMLSALPSATLGNVRRNPREYSLTRASKFDTGSNHGGLES